jgi:hypothetical protein
MDRKHIQVEKTRQEENIGKIFKVDKNSKAHLYHGWGRTALPLKQRKSILRRFSPPVQFRH